MTVSWPPEPLLLRASSEPPPRVLKIAQGELLKSTPNPTCCAPSVVKVATKSSDRPAVYVPAVPTRAPSPAPWGCAITESCLAHARVHGRDFMSVSDTVGSPANNGGFKVLRKD